MSSQQSEVDQLTHCQAENMRLRELYENAVGNRKRFGWTINHLLECEDVLMVTQEQLRVATAVVRELAEVHHRTITGSRKHDPENQDWTECSCRTCQLAQPYAP